MPAMSFDDGFGDGQPQTMSTRCSSPGRVRPEKPIEELLLSRGGDPAPRVANYQNDIRPIRFDTDINPSLGLVVVDGVTDQIHGGPREIRRIAAHDSG